MLPLAEDDVKRRVVGCLQSPPYPIDGGPECVRADGTFVIYSGWGDGEGKVLVVGNKIRKTTRASNGTEYDWGSLSFHQDPAGNLFYREQGNGARDRYLPLKLYPESEYLRARSR